MIALWLLAAFIAGGFCGVLVMCLMLFGGYLPEPRMAIDLDGKTDG